MKSDWNKLKFCLMLTAVLVLSGCSLFSLSPQNIKATPELSSTETLHPDFEVQATEGQNCEPQCQQGKEEITLPESTSMEINTQTPSASVPTKTLTEQPSGGFVYYVFVDLSHQSIPEGSIEILPEALVLTPKAVSAGDLDPAESLQAALSAMIADENNAWTTENLTVKEIMFQDGHAMVAMEGEIFGAGDIVLIAARMQFLMTLFANQAVQTATVTLNGENIANWGISNSLEARPIEDAFTRAEIETFIQEHSFKP